MGWDRINAVGWQMERLLAWTVLSVAFAVALLLLLRAEWALVPAEARGHIVCSEILADTAGNLPLSLDRSHPSQADVDLKRELQDCEHSADTSLPRYPILPPPSE